MYSTKYTEVSDCYEKRSHFEGFSDAIVVNITLAGNEHHVY
ncbi:MULTISPECIES: hypothetical protein [Nostoc]|nr:MULTISPECIES: hypothetical protein [Nostoc]